MSVGMTLAVEDTPIERVDADLAAAGFFCDDRPLRGQAGRADWRLCGLISQLVLEGRLQGERGESVLVPSAGSLRAPRLLLIGLGTRSQFGNDAARAAMREFVARSLALRLRRVAIAPPCVGMAELAGRASVLLEGVVDAARESEANSLDLRLVLPRNELLAAFLSGLEKAIETGSHGVDLRLVGSLARGAGRH